VSDHPGDNDAHISPDLAEALRVFSHRNPALIALDFDGTLAPLVDDPMESRMLPEAHEALLTLGALTGVTVALVSGRAIDSLRLVAEPSDDWYLVGSHGGEIVPPGMHHSYTARSRVPADLNQAFCDVVEQHPGTRLERKAFGLALHTRGVDGAVASRAEASARLVCESFEGNLRIRAGHGILECSVLEATKADGIAALREATGAEATLFAGDDVTDQDAIACLGSLDVGIWVGEGSSAAPHRLADADHVAAALGLLASFAVSNEA